MLIFRVEHNREVCDNVIYRKGGESLTGHGPASGGCIGERPNYGKNGVAPYNIMIHQRCAGTIDQFPKWVNYMWDRECQDLTSLCEGIGECFKCPATLVRRLTMPKGWDIVCYEVNDDAEGIDWEIDNDQVIFNPAFATCLGVVELSEIEEILKEKISA